MSQLVPCDCKVCRQQAERDGLDQLLLPFEEVLEHDQQEWEEERAEFERDGTEEDLPPALGELKCDCGHLQSVHDRGYLRCGECYCEWFS